MTTDFEDNFVLENPQIRRENALKVSSHILSTSVQKGSLYVVFPSETVLTLLCIDLETLSTYYK